MLMDHDTLLLALELAALAIVIGFGVWRFNRVSRRSNAVRQSDAPSRAGYDMRRDGQRLSVD
jgi:ABC-type nickel/cobalt efflux system permease component RcnA